MSNSILRQIQEIKKTMGLFKNASQRDVEATIFATIPTTLKEAALMAEDPNTDVWKASYEIGDETPSGGVVYKAEKLIDSNAMLYSEIMDAGIVSSKDAMTTDVLKVFCETLSEQTGEKWQILKARDMSKAFYAFSPTYKDNSDIFNIFQDNSGTIHVLNTSLWFQVRDLTAIQNDLHAELYVTHTFTLDNDAKLSHLPDSDKRPIKEKAIRAAINKKLCEEVVAAATVGEESPTQYEIGATGPAGGIIANRMVDDINHQTGYCEAIIIDRMTSVGAGADSAVAKRCENFTSNGISGWQLPDEERLKKALAVIKPVGNKLVDHRFFYANDFDSAAKKENLLIYVDGKGSCIEQYTDINEPATVIAVRRFTEKKDYDTAIQPKVKESVERPDEEDASDDVNSIIEPKHINKLLHVGDEGPAEGTVFLASYNSIRKVMMYVEFKWVGIVSGGIKAASGVILDKYNKAWYDEHTHLWWMLATLPTLRYIMKTQKFKDMRAVLGKDVFYIDIPSNEQGSAVAVLDSSDNITVKYIPDTQEAVVLATATFEGDANSTKMTENIIRSTYMEKKDSTKDTMEDDTKTDTKSVTAKTTNDTVKSTSKKDTISCPVSSIQDIIDCFDKNNVDYTKNEDGSVDVGSLNFKDDNNRINVTYDGKDSYSYMYLKKGDASDSAIDLNTKQHSIEIYRNFNKEDGGALNLAGIVIKDVSPKGRSDASEKKVIKETMQTDVVPTEDEIRQGKIMAIRANMKDQVGDAATDMDLDSLNDDELDKALAKQAIEPQSTSLTERVHRVIKEAAVSNSKDGGLPSAMAALGFTDEEAEEVLQDVLRDAKKHVAITDSQPSDEDLLND